MLIKGDATNLPLADNSVAVVITSPPYNVGHEGYGDDVSDSLEWEDYCIMASDACLEMERVLVSGGRAWVNVQSTVPLRPGDNSRRINLLGLWSDALESSGLEYRDTITWVQDSHDGACAWGSWLQPTAPNQRGGWEAILCFYKDTWKRTPPDGMDSWRDERHGLGGDWGNDLARNVWKIPPARKKPTFPIELPARAIRLSSWPSEIVLDPFVGTGPTIEAAGALKRIGLGVDRSDSMLHLARNR